MRMRDWIVKFALLIALTAALSSAQKTDWANAKGLTIGGETKVSLEGGASFRGQLQQVTDDSLIIAAAGSERSLPRTQIKEVAIKGNNHRGRNAVIGLGIGAVTGLGVGAGVDHGFGHRFGIGELLATPIGAILGTIIGAVWPTGTWHDVYRK
jgi:hypothetical protein